MATRNVTKQLICAEDIAHGVGTLNQVRGGQSMPLRKVDVPYAINDISELAALDPVEYPRVRLGAFDYIAQGSGYKKSYNMTSLQYAIGVTLTANYPYAYSNGIVAEWIGVLPHTITGLDTPDFSDIANWKIFQTSADAALREGLISGTADIAGVSAAKIAAAVSAVVMFTAAAWGADPFGVLDNTAAFNNAYAYAKAIGGELHFPAGRYKGRFLIDGEAPVKGAGARRTALTPFNTSYTVKIFGNAGDANLGAHLSSLSIEATGGVGTGLYCGDPSSTGFSNGSVEYIELKGFENNIFLAQSIVCEFSHVWSHDSTYGINFDNERNVTTAIFNSCRFTTNQYNCKMASGHVVQFNSCAFESASKRNLWLYTGSTSGPTKVVFNGCWFEDITSVAAGNSNLYFDMGPTKVATKGMDIRFNYCAISTPNGIPDINAQNAQNVLFDTCSFSATADAFSATKFVFSTGNNSVRIKLKNCGKVQEMPTAAMYANMPALFRLSGGVFGFMYEFREKNGKLIDNFRTLRISTDATSLQVAYVETIVVDTTAGNVSINSLVGGYSGQQLAIVKTVAANNLNIRNNGTGTEKVYTPSGSDVTLTGRAGYRLACVDSAWYQC